MEYSEALLWLLLFQVQQERLDLGKMAESPGWPGGEEDLFLYQQINVGKALWLRSEKKPGNKHKENSLGKADEPTVGILHWGLETPAPGCWKHWKESREKPCESLQNGRSKSGGSQRVNFGSQKIELVFPGSTGMCALLWSGGELAYRAQQRGVQTPPLVWAEKTEMLQRKRGWMNFSMWTIQSCTN